MKRAGGLLVRVLWTLFVGSCGGPQGGSGTNTNWLVACSDGDECGAGASCLCGLCTTVCDETTDCQGGVCGSPLASLAQCAGAEARRLCLPSADACTAFGLSDDPEFGSAVTPTCGLPGALVCESFDGALPEDYSLWQSSEAARASLQDCLVEAGAGAFRVQADGFGWVQNRIRLPAPVGEGPLHLRFYAYASSAYPAPDYLILAELRHVDDATPEKISVELTPGDDLRVLLGPNQRSLHFAGPGNVPRDEWVCLELALDVAASTGSLALFVNGEQRVQASDVTTLPPGPFTVLSVGAVPSDESVGTDVAIDELVVATEPIGCR